MFEKQLNNLKTAKKITIWRLFLLLCLIVVIIILGVALLNNNQTSFRTANAISSVFIVLIIAAIFTNLVLVIMSIVKVASLSHEFKKLVPESNILLIWLILAIFFGIIFDIVFLVSAGSAIRRGESILQTQITEVDTGFNTPLDSASYSQQTDPNNRDYNKTTSFQERLAKLEKLKKNGDISNEEYQKLREKVLSEF